MSEVQIDILAGSAVVLASGLFVLAIAWCAKHL